MSLLVKAFSNKNTKVLAMLVCFYDPDLGWVVCEHLRSAEFVTVNSGVIFTSYVILIISLLNVLLYSLYRKHRPCTCRLQCTTPLGVCW